MAQPEEHTQAPLESQAPWPEQVGFVEQLGEGALWKKHQGTEEGLGLGEGFQQQPLPSQMAWFMPG